MDQLGSSIVAVAGTLLGAFLAYLAQSRVVARQISEARRDRRREDFIEAASAFADTITRLTQAEYNRSKKRLADDDTPARELARQQTYDRRSDAKFSLLRLQLFSGADAEVASSAEGLLELCRKISDGPDSSDELNARHNEAKQALAQFVREAAAYAAEF